jgi:hypothetical protein
MSEGNITAGEEPTLRDTEPERIGLRPHLFALLGYLALALVVTYPAVLHFATAVPGDLVADRDQNLWNLWWLKEALGHGANPFHTNLLYFPYGADLYYHTLAVPLGLIGLVPQLLFGLPAAYNSVLIIAFTLSGYGAFRLALLYAGRRTKDEGRRVTNVQLFAAFVGGVVFAFTPYTLDALKGQLEVLSLQWMPLYAEMWIRAMRGTDGGRWTVDSGQWWVYALLAGLFLALAAYSSLYYAVYLAVFTLAHIAYKLGVGWRNNAAGRSSVVGRRSSVVAVTVTVGLVTLLLTLPLLVGLVADRSDPRLAVEADPQHRLAHSADLLSFFAPPHDHIIFGTWQDQPGVNEPPIHDYVGLGYVALALAIIGSVVGWRRQGSGTRFWAGLGLLALVLAMGPELQVGRNLTGIPLPFALLDKLPGIDAIAKPERFVVLARLCMGVLAAGGAVWLLERVWRVRHRQGRRASLAFTLILALLLVELPIHPRYMGPYSIPQGFEALAQQPPGGLMELPFATQQVDVIGQRMLYQTVHGKPIMAGYLSRRYDSPIIDSCSPFWGFISPLDVPREDIASPLVVLRLQDVLNFYEIKYLALYSKNGGPDADPVDPAQMAALEGIVREVAPSQPLYADGYVTLDKVAPVSLNDAPPSFHIGAGWYDVEQSSGTPFRWAEDTSGTLCVFAPRKVTAPIHLEATAFAQDRQMDLSAAGKSIFAGKVTASAFISITTTPVEWQPGITEVRVTASGPGVTPRSVDPNLKDDRLLTVGLRQVYLAIEGQK